MGKYEEMAVLFASHEDKENAASMEKYMKNRFEFFINKAIGWALREYSKTDAAWVKEFIDSHKEEMNTLSIKEGCKYLK